MTEEIAVQDSAPEVQQEIARVDDNQSFPGTRVRSGFAKPGYWDEIGDQGLTRREEKSLWAKKQNEAGILGGRQPGAGRPRKNRSVAEVVTEKASEPKHAEAIARNLIQMATQHKSPSVQLGAIDRLNKFEQDLEKNMRDDEKELRKLSGPSLDARLKEVLSEFADYDYDVPPEDVEEDV